MPPISISSESYRECEDLAIASRILTRLTLRNSYCSSKHGDQATFLIDCTDTTSESYETDVPRTSEMRDATLLTSTSLFTIDPLLPQKANYKGTERKTLAKMGSIIGKENVAEPAFKVMLERDAVKTVYEIREYGKRFVGM